MLKRRFPDVYAETATAKELPFEITPFKTAKGHLNVDCVGKFGRIPWYDTDDILGKIRASMVEWRLETHDYLICVGLGLGYQALMAVDAFQKLPAHLRPGIMVFERFPAMFWQTLQLMDLRRLLAYEHLQIHVGDFNVASLIPQMSYDLFLGKQLVVSDAGSTIVFGERFRTLEKEIYSHIGLSRDLWHTTKEFGPVIFENTLKNLPALFSGQTLGQVRGTLEGLPVFCVSAGPSLDTAIPFLKRVNNRAVILAIDSAIPALISAGITPHMVVTADVRSINIRKYRAYLESLRETILIYAVESNPDNIYKYLGKRRISVSINNPILNRWLSERWPLECGLPAMTTVTHAAVFTAMEMGGNPIVFVGMDMAFSDGKTHAKGAIHQYDINGEELVAVDGVRGLPVRTYRPLNNYRMQLEEVIVRRGEQFINTSMEGAWIRGTTVKSMQEVLDTELEPETKILSALDAMGRSPRIDNEKILKELAWMATETERFIDVCHEAPALGGIQKCNVNGLSKEIKAFEAAHPLLTGILQGVRLKEAREIERRIRTLRRQKTPATVTELTALWRDYMKSFDRAAKRFLKSMVELVRFYREEVSQTTVSMPTIEDRMVHAKFYSECGHLRTALNVYTECRSRAPENIGSWILPASLLLENQIFAAALRLIFEGLSKFPDDRQLQALLSKFKKQTDELFRSAAGQLREQKPVEANMQILEFLAVFPKHAQANELKRAINSAMEARSGLERDGVPGCSEEMDRLLGRASMLIKSEEPERAIGIFEALAETKKGQPDHFHALIGDFRFASRDYKSAKWHYERALRLNGSDARLLKKIESSSALA